MRKATEILNLRVLFIMEGKELPEPKGMIIEPKGAKVNYLIVNDGQWLGGIKLLPFDKILSIGEDAITARTMNDIFVPDEDARALIQKEVKMFDTRVFSEKGKYLGKVVEYTIDEETGRIAQCELDDESVIQHTDFVTLSRDVVIVASAATKAAAAQPEKAELPAVEEPAVQADASFDSKQKRFLIGRIAKKAIYDNDNNMLVNVGQTIDEAIVDSVTKAGKIIELVTNTKV